MQCGRGTRKVVNVIFWASFTHTHTRSCNSRAHNTEIPQPGCACVRIVYSFWNIMLSILSNDMHSTRAGAGGGEQGGQGLSLGLDRHFSYWQCLIQSVVCLSISLSRSLANFYCQLCVFSATKLDLSCRCCCNCCHPIRKSVSKWPKRGNFQLWPQYFLAFFSFWPAKAFTVAFN